MDHGIPGPDLGASCDPTRSVASDGSALLERDPAALAAFSLERVLVAADRDREGASLTPLELLQRLLDTMNTSQLGAFTDNVHCNDSANAAFSNAPPADCPRAEGVLATSAAAADAATHSDSFVPVAVVNRFDLAPRDFPTCGEFRLVFAKRSGQTDPRNRLLLIFESVLTNASLASPAAGRLRSSGRASRPVPSAAERGARLEQFLFDGMRRIFRRYSRR